MTGRPAATPPGGSAAVSGRTWWTAVIYVAALAMVLRFYDLPLKPLHHDEGVNTLLLQSLVRPPHAYRYDPANYHGPTLYYFSWLSVTLFGLTTVAIRLVTALAGFVSVLLLLLLRRQIGTVGALAASVLLAVSPGAVYFSRYYIHESLLACFTLGTVIAWTLWWKEKRSAYLLLGAASAGLMIATKETALISAVVLMAAFLGAGVFEDLRSWWKGGRRSMWRHLRSTFTQQRRAGQAAVRDRGGLVPILLAFAVLLGIVVLFYTSFLTHWGGGIDAVRAFAIWTKTGTSAHTRGWHTYVQWLWAEEGALLLLGGVGAVAALWRFDSRFAAFASLWTIGTLAAYSVIPYKTPWLTLNIIAPLVISGGYACDLVWRSRHRLPRAVPMIAGVTLIGIATYQAVVLSFSQYDDGRHPYVYVHTSREVLALVQEVHRLQALNPRATIAVTSRDHFPLSWYLRAYSAGYYGRAIVTNDPVVIASEDQRGTLEVALGSQYERVGSYTLRPGVRLVLYVRRDLRRAPVEGTDVAGVMPPSVE